MTLAIIVNYKYKDCLPQTVFNIDKLVMHIQNAFESVGKNKNVL